MVMFWLPYAEGHHTEHQLFQVTSEDSEGILGFIINILSVGPSVFYASF